jgi:hypothetical protein
MSKGGTTTQGSTTEIPQWVQDAGKEQYSTGKELGQIGYTPYYGADVAAFNPMQESAFRATGSAADAFGIGPAGTVPTGATFGPHSPTWATDGIQTPTDYAGGVQGYSGMPMYSKALEKLGTQAPAQKRALERQFIDPTTGLTPEGRDIQDINGLYNEAFGRNVGLDGLGAYLPLVQQGMGKNDLRSILYNSDEAKALGKTSYNVPIETGVEGGLLSGDAYKKPINLEDYRSQLNAAYMAQFGRELGQEGLDFYGQQMYNGKDWNQILAEITNSAEGLAYITPAEQAILDAKSASATKTVADVAATTVTVDGTGDTSVADAAAAKAIADAKVISDAAAAKVISDAKIAADLKASLAAAATEAEKQAAIQAAADAKAIADAAAAKVIADAKTAADAAAAKIEADRLAALAVTNGTQTIGGLLTDTNMSTDTISAFDAFGSEIDTLNKAYMQEMGRPVGEEGLLFYGQQLKDGTDISSIIADLAYSGEGQAYITPAEQAAIDQAAIDAQSVNTGGSGGDESNNNTFTADSGEFGTSFEGLGTGLGELIYGAENQNNNLSLAQQYALYGAGQAGNTGGLDMYDQAVALDGAAQQYALMNDTEALKGIIANTTGTYLDDYTIAGIASDIVSGGSLSNALGFGSSPVVSELSNANVIPAGQTVSQATTTPYNGMDNVSLDYFSGPLGSDAGFTAKYSSNGRSGYGLLGGL